MLKKRFLKVPGKSFFLFGPRGVGKSTWLDHHLTDAYFVGLLDVHTFRKHRANPGLIQRIVEDNMHFNTFVIDEIQKVPEILNSIHLLIEKYKDKQFILTGSSERKLKRSGFNLMAGRVLLKKMYPFMASELGSSFNLEDSLKYGLVPIVITDPYKDDTLSSYISLYLKEEIEAEGLVRDLGLFANFMEIISFSHGQLLNLSNIAREANVSRDLTENYVSVLEDLMLSYRLPVFAKRPKRNLMRTSKFYFFDVGIFNELRPKREWAASEVVGPAMEGLVLQHLKAWAEYSVDNDIKLYFWRTKSGLEVDFVVESENYFYAIEVKTAKNIHSKDLRGLKEFKLDYPQVEPVMVYGGEERIKVEGVLCIPIKEFLQGMIPNKRLT